MNLHALKIEQLSTAMHRHNRLANTRVRDARVYGALAIGWAAATILTAGIEPGLVWLAWGAGFTLWTAAAVTALVISRKHYRRSDRLRHRIANIREMDRLVNGPARRAR